MIWVVLAIVLVTALFFLKNKTTFKNENNNTSKEQGLAYSTETFQDLVAKDTDADGIPDWQEKLFGLDPTKKETTAGTPDNVAISKLKAEQGVGASTSVNTKNEKAATETEKFSRELFAAVAAANQNGAMDQATIDALGASLAEKIENPESQKIFTLGDLKITGDDSAQNFKKYNDTLNNIYDKYHTGQATVTGVLQKLVEDENNMSILKELDPTISALEKIINDLVKMEVPPSLSSLHLNLINSSQRLLENTKGIRLLETDTIVAIGAITQYQTNSASLEASARALLSKIGQKLNN